MFIVYIDIDKYHITQTSKLINVREKKQIEIDVCERARERQLNFLLAILYI
jgi:hypothetical protein